MSNIFCTTLVLLPSKLLTWEKNKAKLSSSVPWRFLVSGWLRCKIKSSSNVCSIYLSNRAKVIWYIIKHYRGILLGKRVARDPTYNQLNVPYKIIGLFDGFLFASAPVYIRSYWILRVPAASWRSRFLCSLYFISFFPPFPPDAAAKHASRGTNVLPKWWAEAFCKTGRTIKLCKSLSSPSRFDGNLITWRAGE